MKRCLMLVCDTIQRLNHGYTRDFFAVDMMCFYDKTKTGRLKRIQTACFNLLYR